MLTQHTIFQSPTKATIEQELAGEQPRSQLWTLAGRARDRADCSHTPQAKGRVERLGYITGPPGQSTPQSRGFQPGRSQSSANQFLPKYNQRFRVSRLQQDSLCTLAKGISSQRYFCFKHTRSVSNDNTISFDGHRLQIPPGPKHRTYARAKVQIKQHLDGRLEICYQGKVW
jgi:hypothetical protein